MCCCVDVTAHVPWAFTGETPPLESLRPLSQLLDIQGQAALYTFVTSNYIEELSDVIVAFFFNPNPLHYVIIQAMNK